MRHKWILVLLAFSSCGFTSRANADFPPRLDSQLLDPNGIILNYGADDGSLHIYQLPDATPLTTLSIYSESRTVPVYSHTGPCSPGLIDTADRFFYINPAGFSDLDCIPGTMTPNLSLEFLAADLRIDGRVLGGGNITDAILVPEPSGQLGFMLAALASFSFWRSHKRSNL
ncbi:MAG: hypothetical protein R3C28_09095 [Pirellulaceae bacterium]